jgi:hypothetical protein
VDLGPVSPPGGQQPTPKPELEKPVREPRDIPRTSPRGGEDTVRPEGRGAQGESGGLPDQVSAHTPGNVGSEAPGQPEVHPGPGTAHEPDTGGSQLPAAVGKDSVGGGNGYKGTAASEPAGDQPSGTGTGQPSDRRAATAALPGHEPASGTRSAEYPSHPTAKAAADDASRAPTAVRGDGSGRAGGHSQALGAASPAAPAGYGARTASEAPFGSTEYFFGYLWHGGGVGLQQARGGLGPVRGPARDPVAATAHGGSLTPRAPPLPVPSPFSGFGLTMGGAVFGASSSGDGHAPLLAVIFCCLSAVLWRGRPRAYGALLRAGTVPRLALERPG